MYKRQMESYKVFRTFLQAAEHMEKLFGMVPGAVACDLHPGYATAGEAARLAEERNLPLFPFQHHHAHAASVMAEHGLRRCIAVVFDGTGYGTDGTVWGGEFLLCEGGSFLRAGHLEETELAGGDSSAKDAGLTALCQMCIRDSATFTFNTVKLTVIITFIQVITSSFAAYGFSKCKFKGRDVLFLCYVATIAIPWQVYICLLYTSP